MPKSLTFKIPGLSQTIRIYDSALRTFNEYKPTEKRNEAGGILLAQINQTEISITEATPPNSKDKCSFNRFEPDLKEQNRIIKRKHKQGLHYVGEWHTHNEPFPTPSQIDIKSMKEAFDQSSHILSYFLLIIIGSADTEDGFWISAHNHEKFLKLNSTEN